MKKKVIEVVRPYGKVQEAIHRLFEDLRVSTLASLAAVESSLASKPSPKQRKGLLSARRKLKKVLATTQAHVEWYDAQRDGTKAN